MKALLKYVLGCSLIFTFSHSGAQTPEYQAMAGQEKVLEELFDLLYSDTLEDPDPVLKEIMEVMPAALGMDGALDYTWKGLDRIGVVTSKDGKVRLFTWHVMDDPDHFRYFGYIQVGQKRGRIGVFELKDNGIPQRNLTKLEQSADNWYGKLYYGIVTESYRRRTVYALLGMDFNDSRSNIKTVEALELQRQHPIYTHELFFNGRDKVDRMVFEYSEQVSVSVRFDPELNMITADHLVPFHPIYEGNYEFYGPDGSYDGMEYTSGMWVYREDIDARNSD